LLRTTDLGHPWRGCIENSLLKRGRKTKKFEKPWFKTLLTESYLLYMSTKKTGN